MWLINVRTRKLEGFHGKELPRYAILSHRWSAKEISFQDIRSWGFSARRWPDKLAGLRITAIEAGIDHVWVDTCSINKSDLVELSESINSMFSWYARASVCYVYLADVYRDSGAEMKTRPTVFWASSVSTCP